MFKTQVEPQSAGKLFHCQVLNILWCHFIAYKSIDHRKLLLICFLQQLGKIVSRISFIFHREKACALHLMSFLLSVLL